MGGLIWAGIGKGIADAGTTFGGMGIRQYERDEQERRDELRDERAAQREERRALLQEELRREREDREAEERAKFSQRVSERADEMPIKRDAGIIGRLATKVGGESEAMSEEEIAKLIKENPQYREVYRQAGYIKDTVDPRLQRANDESQAARELGGRATWIEAFDKAKKDTLAQITQENKDKREQGKADQANRRLDLIDKRITSQNTTDAIRANRPAGGAADDKPATTADIQRQINATRDDLALALGATRTDLNQAVAAVQRKAAAGDPKAVAKLSEIQPFLDELKDANDRMRQFKRPAKEDAPAPSPAPKPADNQKPASTVSSLPQGAVQIGTSGGKPVYQTPDGKKFIAK